MENKKEITLEKIADLIQTLDAKIDSTTKTLEAQIESSRNEIIETLEAKIASSSEELATMTQKQFLELGEKVNRVEKKITVMESKIDNFEAELNKKVNKTDHNTFKYRIEKLEEKFA